MQYLPIEGLAAFNKATAELLLGADNPAIKQQRVSSGFRKYRSVKDIIILVYECIKITNN